jgi:hypothetical protein
MGTFGGFWSSSYAPTSGFGYGVGMMNDADDIGNNDQMDGSWGLSIRCVHNSGSNPGGMIDPRTGQIYRTVELGDQTWMAENLNLNTAGSWVYNDDLANAATYGRLYDFPKACGVYLQLDYQSIGMSPLTDEKNVGYSVRCVKNQWYENHLY